MVNASFEIDDGGGYVTIEREEALNALDTPTKAAITERLRDWRDEDAVRAVVLRSEGDRAFCAGGDIKEIPEVDYSLSYFTETWGELFEAMRDLGKPTIAAVRGYALGGGFDLVCHTDIPIAADDAMLGQPESGLGIVNHFAPPVLLRTVGQKKALDLLLTGEPISGAEAAELGLVSRSVPAEELDAEVESVVASIAEKSPRVMRKLKAGIHDAMELSPAEGREHLEEIALAAARTDPDYREGVEAQLEDREPEWASED
ncbi:MAG: enoyl-CoA hydratase/isomerase family protein [Halobacteriales archaeon]|nr:enoyl-CoA hydratase/isomerase family protein [Halobacteriales archaeon]